MRPHDQLEKPPAATGGPKALHRNQKASRPAGYENGGARASRMSRYLELATDPNGRLGWEDYAEARISLLCQELAEVERENEHLRSRLALAMEEMAVWRRRFGGGEWVVP